MRGMNYYGRNHHEGASKFIGQRHFQIKQSASDQPKAWINCYGLPLADPVQCGPNTHRPEEIPMKKLVFAILLIASPAWAQTKLLPKSVTARADPCAPIGRTADGKLVYSMKCENLPAPPAPPVAEIAPAPEPEPEVQRSGIFGLSYERKRPDQ
jgi:hypothetical protein